MVKINDLKDDTVNNNKQKSTPLSQIKSKQNVIPQKQKLEVKMKFRKQNYLRHTVFNDKNIHKTKYDNPFLRKNRYCNGLTEVYVPKGSNSTAYYAYKKRPHFLSRFSNPAKSVNGTSLDSFILIKTIGKGSFGRVIIALSKNYYSLYAIKMMSKEELVKLRQVKQLLNERAILSACEHPNIIKLNFSFKDNTFVYLTTELACNGDMYNLFIKKYEIEAKNSQVNGRYTRRIFKIGEREAKFYAANIFLALEYLHINDVIFRDLKPENILIADNGYLKLADFGFSKSTEEYSYTLCGTPEYMSPE